MKKVLIVGLACLIFSVPVSAAVTAAACKERLQTIGGLVQLHDIGEKLESTRGMLFPRELIATLGGHESDLALHEVIDELDAYPKLNGEVYLGFKAAQCKAEVAGAKREALSEAAVQALITCTAAGNKKDCGASVAGQK